MLRATGGSHICLIDVLCLDRKDHTLIVEAKGSLCNILMTVLGVNQVVVRFLCSLAEGKGSTKYLEDMQIIINKPVQNS
jgi:hypothetical protein